MPLAAESTRSYGPRPIPSRCRHRLPAMPPRRRPSVAPPRSGGCLPHDRRTPRLTRQGPSVVHLPSLPLPRVRSPGPANGPAQRPLLSRSSTRTRTPNTGRRRNQIPTHACNERTYPRIHLVGTYGQDLLTAAPTSSTSARSTQSSCASEVSKVAQVRSSCRHRRVDGTGSRGSGAGPILLHLVSFWVGRASQSSTVAHRGRRTELASVRRDGTTPRWNRATTDAMTLQHNGWIRWKNAHRSGVVFERRDRLLAERSTHGVRALRVDRAPRGVACHRT